MLPCRSLALPYTIMLRCCQVSCTSIQRVGWGSNVHATLLFSSTSIHTFMLRCCQVSCSTQVHATLLPLLLQYIRSCYAAAISLALPNRGWGGVGGGNNVPQLEPAHGIDFREEQRVKKKNAATRVLREFDQKWAPEKTFSASDEMVPK